MNTAWSRHRGAGGAAVSSRRTALHIVSGRVLLCVLLGTSPQLMSQTDDQNPNWRLTWANDAFFFSDNQFTNGLGVSKHSALAETLEEADHTAAFGRRVAELLLPAGPGLNYREGWTLGHNIQTPDRISEEDIILNDVPYVSMLAWTNSHIAFDDRSFTGFQTLFGWVGDVTLGEQLQKGVHVVVGANDPEGWDNQLDNEPLFNLYYMKKHKFLQRSWFDAAIDVDVAAGNMFTFAQTALEFRFGNRPRGFAYQVNTIGHALDFDARIHQPRRHYLYATLVLRATAMAYALPRDGNLLRSDNRWTEENNLDPEDFLGQLALGLHYERDDWGAHLNLFYGTDTVENAGNTALEDPNNNFATVLFEWQF